MLKALLTDCDVMDMKCKCGKNAIIFRKYEGRALCRPCFCRSIERKFKKVVGKYRMIEHGDKIAVALSGGKDSAAVLYLMHTILKPRRDVKLFAISVDEGIKGSRDLALKKAREICKKLGIEQHVFSFKKELGKTLDQKVRKDKIPIEEICGLCGICRRWILNKEARKLGATKICMGMNLDDEAESVMMNYIRGDILRASRLGPVTDYSRSKTGGELFIPRIKPLRWIPEKEIGLFAKLKKLPYHAKHCKYRGGLRVDVEEILNILEKKHVGVAYTVLSTFDAMLPGIRKSIAYSEPNIYKCKKCGEPSSHSVCKVCLLWR